VYSVSLINIFLLIVLAKVFCESVHYSKVTKKPRGLTTFVLLSIFAFVN